MGLPTLLFLIFLVLKLTDNIDWSWWWVTSPLWIELLVGILIYGVFGAVAFRNVKKNESYRKNNMNRW